MRELVEKVSGRLTALKLTLVTAESCTGGMIAAAMTDRPGSSAVFECGFVTYSNESKTKLLGVPQDVLAKHGAVSAETAQAMAKGALERSRAGAAVSVTGIAGPGGGTAEKPVGLVHIGYALRDGKIHSTEHRFTGDREAVRRQAAEAALDNFLKFL